MTLIFHFVVFGVSLRVATTKFRGCDSREVATSSVFLQLRCKKRVHVGLGPESSVRRPQTRLEALPLGHRLLQGAEEDAGRVSTQFRSAFGVSGSTRRLLRVQALHLGHANAIQGQKRLLIESWSSKGKSHRCAKVGDWGDTPSLKPLRQIYFIFSYL